MQICVKFTLEILTKYFTFIALSQSRCTASLSLLCFLRFLSTTQPTISPSVSPITSSTIFITGSTFFITTHHRLSLHRCHPSPAHVVGATTSSQVLLVPLSILFLLQDYLVGFLKVELWWDLLLVGRRWIW